MLSTLSHRERKVLELRFGLAAASPHARGGRPRFGVTRERIRQIEARALLKLKSYRETQRLQRLTRATPVRSGHRSSVAQW